MLRLSFSKTKRLLLKYIKLNFSTIVKCDAIVIGSGIAGSSVGYQLSKLGLRNTICLEKNSNYGLNTTKKSYGIFSENYGTKEIKILSYGSRPFFENPPSECIQPMKNKEIQNYLGSQNNHIDNILQITGLLALSKDKDYDSLYKEFGPKDNFAYDLIKVVPKEEISKKIPFLNMNVLGKNGIYEKNACSLNTKHAYELFLRGCLDRDVILKFDSKIQEISKLHNGNWEIIVTENGNEKKYECGLLINASGDYCDEIAKMTKIIKPLNCKTYRRNVIDVLFKNNNENNNIHIKYPWLAWLNKEDNEQFYGIIHKTLKHGLFLSTPIVHDDKKYSGDYFDHATEKEIEFCKKKIQDYTNLEVESLKSRSAGIRVHVYDNNVVIGPDQKDSSFIWCTGLGGWGIQAAPGISEVTALLALNKDITPTYVDMGLNIDHLTPFRFNQQNMKKIS